MTGIKRVLIGALMVLGCSDQDEKPADKDIDAGLSDAVSDIAWSLPSPTHSHAEYVSLAEEICGTPEPDRSKIVFQLQDQGGHAVGLQLNWRNGTPTFLFINEACEMWVQAFYIADSFLALPVQKHLSFEEMAHILEKYRVLEFSLFDNTKTTFFISTETPSYTFLTFRDRTYAIGSFYDGVFGGNGEVEPGLKFYDFKDYELLAIAVLKDPFWEDPAIMVNTQAYMGDRLWISVWPQEQVISPERLFQAWPLDKSVEELGWVSVSGGCSDDFVVLEGDDADAFRQARTWLLSQEPATSAGHFAVPMVSGENRYWVEMAEGLPVEDEFGYVTFRGERVYYRPCPTEPE